MGLQWELRKPSGNKKRVENGNITSLRGKSYVNGNVPYSIGYIS